MTLSELSKKLVAVLGYGVEGQAITQYLLKHGIKPVLFDQRPWEQWEATEQEKIKLLGVNFIFGPDCFKELTGFEVAFRSPGVKLSSLNLAHFVSKGLVVTSQTKWFFENCPAKIIGVTGTKGKGTTCALIYEMLKLNLKGQMPNVFLTGNIGTISPLEILDNLKPEDRVIYELSSFQLQDLEISPHIAVVLMVTSEHLDYHQNTEQYIKAKSNITRHQNEPDFTVVNADFGNSLKIGVLGRAKKFYFSRKKKENMDCWVETDEIIIKDSGLRIPITSLQLKGAHNLENVCAAALAARLAGTTDNAVLQAVAEFKGLEHRLEFVLEKHGIKFYDDSFSTTPETTIAAIESFSEPLIVILGGSAKKSDFTSLGKTLNSSKNIKALILVGQESARIKKTITNPSLKILEGAQNMQEIFSQVKAAASNGDVVLLSPACASFDMFKDYKDRGEQFKNLAKNF